MNKRWPTACAAAAIAWYASDSLRHRREGRRGYALRTDLDVGSHEFLVACEALTGQPVLPGNRIDLLVNGKEIFPRFLETVETAERTLNLATYVYWTGQIARDVADVLSERAHAGVECNVLLDAVGTAKMDSSLLEDLERSGVRVARFRPPRPYAIRRLTKRLHRRILVVDAQVGMTGGVGIARQWTGDAEDPDHWRDTHVWVDGPIVRSLQGAFAENWLEATGEVLVGDDFVRSGGGHGDGVPMQVIRSSAGVGDSSIEALYYLALACARREVKITAGYFAPRPAFVDALTEAAARGVDVRVLVPGSHIDKEIVRQVGRSTYADLLEGGVRVFEFEPTMLHAKTITIDGAWSSVGSVNFDNRSFQLNDEATLCVSNSAFAADLNEVFDRDVSRSNEITPEQWRERSMWNRVQETAPRIFRREL